jgi:alpha-galactosidase
MKWVADQIRAQGLRPGLWLAVFGDADESFYNAHKDWFLRDEQGNAKR